MSANFDLSDRPDYDKLITEIADYVCDYEITSEEAWKTAQYCLMDTLGCGFLALRFPECTKHLGPIVPGTKVPVGSKVPGTQFYMDPVKSAWDIGCIIRWLDYNDTWLAAEWGHPSDNLGGILAVADYISRKNLQEGKEPLTMKVVLEAMIKAHEIQGVLALENSFNRVGLCHVLLVRVASTAVVTKMLGGTKEQIKNAISQAWVDGSSLRTYRHAPNAGSRKSWAAGDATSRAVKLALMSIKGEMGLPSVMTAKTWGFHDVSFKGKEVVLSQPLGSYVMENILFKISFPAEFHAQTAVEGAVRLHNEIKDKLQEIEKIKLITHESAIRIISKVGPLANPADRDHCIQYMVACGLAFGNLIAEHYEDDVANMPIIDELRDKMEIEENEKYTKEYLEADKRSIANSIQIFFKDGTSTNKIDIDYPVGHRKRRKEGIPLLINKFKNNVTTRFPKGKSEEIFEVLNDFNKLTSTSVNTFTDMTEI